MKDRSIPLVPASSRRRFVRGLAVGGAALIGSSQLLPARAFAAVGAQMYVATHPALDLEGVGIALVSVSGGAPYADITKEPDVGDGLTHLRPGPPKFEDIVIQVSFDGLPPLISWINGTLAKGPSPKNGAIAYLDYNMAQIKRLEFTNAIITEVTLPACNATDKSAANVTLRLTPEHTQLVDGKQAKPLSMPKLSPKRVLASNFKLSVERLENASKGVVKISPVTAKRTVGGLNEKSAMMRSPLECSVLSVTLAEQDALPFYSNWFATSTLVGTVDERGVLIDWLSPDLATSVATAALGGVGILRYEPLPTPGDAIAQVQVDMYFETLSLKA